MAKAARQNNGKAISKRAQFAGAMWKGLYDTFTGNSEKATEIITGTISETLSTDNTTKDLSPEDKTKISNCIDSKIKNGIKITAESVTRCFAGTAAAGTQASPAMIQSIETKLGQKLSQATPATSQIAQPQADRGSCLELAAKKLMDAGYLPATFQYNVAHPWTPEFDKGFRDYIEAASGGKAQLATNPALTWAEVAKIVGQTPDLSGACNAINSTELTAPIKTSETPAATNGTPTTPASPEAPVEQDILARILSYMQNTKAAETVGLNLIAEPRRASILIEASGNVDNAAKVLRAKSEGLSEALRGMTLDGTITPEWVRLNKPALQQIVGAINALVSQAVKHVGKLSLLPADRAKAVEKMKSFISQAAQGIQWTKLASQRKDRIRSNIAAEMTVVDKATARRIRARESV